MSNDEKVKLPPHLAALFNASEAIGHNILADDATVSRTTWETYQRIFEKGDPDVIVWDSIADERSAWWSHARQFLRPRTALNVGMPALGVGLGTAVAHNIAGPLSALATASVTASVMALTIMTLLILRGGAYALGSRVRVAFDAENGSLLAIHAGAIHYHAGPMPHIHVMTRDSSEYVPGECEDLCFVLAPEGVMVNQIPERWDAFREAFAAARAAGERASTSTDDPFAGMPDEVRAILDRITASINKAAKERHGYRNPLGNAADMPEA